MDHCNIGWIFTEPLTCRFIFSLQISQSGDENVRCHRGGSHQLCVFHCERHCCRSVTKRFCCVGKSVLALNFALFAWLLHHNVTTELCYKVPPRAFLVTAYCWHKSGSSVAQKWLMLRHLATLLYRVTYSFLALYCEHCCGATNTHH